MTTKHRRTKLFLVLAILLCLIPIQRSMAKTKAELTKIGAAAKIPDDWVLIDTELSNEEIMKLLDIDDESVISSIRAQWESGSGDSNRFFCRCNYKKEERERFDVKKSYIVIAI